MALQIYAISSDFQNSPALDLSLARGAVGRPLSPHFADAWAVGGDFSRGRDRAVTFRTFCRGSAAPVMIPRAGAVGRWNCLHFARVQVSCVGWRPEPVPGRPGAVRRTDCKIVVISLF